MKRSIEFCFIGIGQGGGRIAAEFINFGYDGLAINTAKVDLEKLDIPSKRKYHIDYGLDGAGRDTSLGRAAFEENRKKIEDFLRVHVPKESDYLIVCAGGGGGTGSGGLVPLLDTLKGFERPVGVILTLPLDSEDTPTKKNVLTTVSGLDPEVSPAVVIDNAKISRHFPGLSVKDFWNRANFEIAKTFAAFNTLTASPSELHSLDKADYMMILRAGGCMTMGAAFIDSSSRETLSEAFREVVSGGLMADFDLSTSRRAGVVLTAPTKAMRGIRADDLDAAFGYVREIMGAGALYRGVYDRDETRVYSLFGGLDFPRERLDALASETKTEFSILQEKRSPRQFHVGVDLDEGDDPLLRFIRGKKR